MSDQREFSLQAEIAELNDRIESKKRELEEAQGIRVEHKEALKEVVSEHVYGEVGSPTSSPATTARSTSAAGDDHYLSTLDAESVEKINSLIEMVGRDGIKKTISAAKNFDPFILDAFHDALVDKLYGELKDQGYIK